jgi:hypothetical protein
LKQGGATKQWPFDAIDCFRQLLGVELQYLFVSDRDFLSDTELAERLGKAKKGKLSLVQLQRRHREAYFVVPEVLARVVEKKWRAKHVDEVVPNDCTVDSIKAFILSSAVKLQETIRTDLIVQHETALRGNSDHRKEGLLELNEYFTDAYTKPLALGEIPFKLLDCKQVLKDFRTHIAGQHHLAFSDRDILDCLSSSDLPEDLLHTLEQVLSLFPPPKSTISPSPADLPGLFESDPK